MPAAVNTSDSSLPPLPQRRDSTAASRPSPVVTTAKGMQQAGSLTLVVARCTNLRSVQKFINQDPYVTAWVEDAPVDKPPRTKTINFGGTEPAWHSNNELHVNVPTPTSIVRVQVWDSEVFSKDRLIAETRISLAEYEDDGAEDLDLVLPLNFEGKPAGEVHTSLTYIPGVVHKPDTTSKPATTASRASWLTTSWTLMAKRHPHASAAVAALPLVVFVLWDLVVALVFALYHLSWFAFCVAVVPLAMLVWGPAWLGWIATFGLSFVVHDYPIVFGAIHIVPWIRFGHNRLYLRVAVDDFTVGAPPNLGFTNPTLVGARRVSCICSVSFEDLWNTVRLRKRPMPLAKVPDFEGFAVLDVEVLHIVGFTFDMEVARGKLNINEMTRTFAVGDVAAKLGLLNVPPERVEMDQRWPNVLEVQVVRARTLLAMDSNGMSDPYAVVSLRGQKHVTKTVLETLNPMWNSEVYRFHITDPSAVLHVQLWDRDFGMQADYLGQWIITLKHLVIDPKHCRHTSIAVDAQGWIDAWLPLADAKWQNVGKCGEINLRMRWRIDSSVAAAPFKMQKGLDQITENSNETKLRLGDMDELTDVLNHVPVLFDFKLVMVTEAKVSIKDLFKSKKAARRDMRRQATSTERPGEYRRDHSASLEPISPQSPAREHARALAMDASGDLPSPSRKAAAALSANTPRDSSTAMASVGKRTAPRLRSFASSSAAVSDAGGDNSDDDDDDDDEDGGGIKRPFVNMPTIRWKTQFAPRHGDPGITVYKCVDRFFRGLLPKLAANSKLNMILVGQSTTGLVGILGEEFSTLIHRNLMPSALLGAALSVVSQAQASSHFIKNKTLSSTSPALPKNSSIRGVDDAEAAAASAVVEPMLRVQADDDDFLVAASLGGVLEACWSGATVPSGAGMRWFGAKRTSWSPWLFEIKHRSLFCKRSKSMAKDRRLCVNLVVDFEASSEEITMSFGKGGTLHLRATRDPLAPSIATWAKALEALLEGR